MSYSSWTNEFVWGIYKLHWVENRDSGDVSCSHRTGLLTEKKGITWEALTCLLSSLSPLILEQLLHWFYLSDSAMLLILCNDIAKNMLNIFLGTLAVEAELYLVDYINHIASTNFPSEWEQGLSKEKEAKK